MSQQSVQIDVARVYGASAASELHRVLVDRLWPRGVKREDLALDEWSKEIAPSDDLRKWYGHDVARWDEFRRRYFEELCTHEEHVEHLLGIAKDRGLLLLFAARDIEHNNAVALREFLLARATGSRG